MEINNKFKYKKQCFIHDVQLETSNFEKKAREVRYAFFEEIIEEKNCLSIKELKINGKDLMDMGVPQGKEIGQILSWLLDQVLEDPQLNERETLTRMAEEKRDAK